MQAEWLEREDSGAGWRQTPSLVLAPAGLEPTDSAPAQPGVGRSSRAACRVLAGRAWLVALPGQIGEGVASYRPAHESTLPPA
jgi:hypothetical protein